MGIGGRRWYLPINGTRGSKATSTMLMTQSPEAPFVCPRNLTVAGREGSNQSPREGS